nr:putative transposase [Ipomoea batatas]
MGRVVEFYGPKDKMIGGFPAKLVDFLIEDNILKSNQTPLQSNHSMSVLSYGNSIDSHSNSKMIVSTISDIYDRAQEGQYFVPARIMDLESGKKWVRDKTSDAPFMLWDNECTQLIGMTAGTLKIKYPKDSVEIPSEVESLHSKAMVFKVSVKNDHLSNPGRPIPVLKIVNDDDLVSTYCTPWTDDQDQLSKMSDEEEGDSESEGSESGDEASSPALDHTGKTISDETDDQMEPGSTKRCLLDQFSSSQDFKRSKSVIIKQEKK